MEIRDLAELTDAVVARVLPTLDDRPTTQRDAASIRGANQAGEWQIALDDLVAVLLDELIPVTPEDLRDLRKLYDHFAQSRSDEVRQRAERKLSDLDRVVVV